MTKTELQAVLSDIGMTPNRRLGQNFLIDENMLDAMLRDARPEAGQLILEIGPGTGVLTEKLLARGCRVVAVELDSRLAAFLNARYADAPNLELVHADACKINYDELLGTREYRCIANLPYACSSVFLAQMLGQANPPRDFHVLLQKEMASRLAARPGTKSYGALTVRVQARYDVKLLRRVPPTVFFPPPEVASAFVSMVPRQAPASEALQMVDVLARMVFAHRRKHALNLLAGRFPKARVSAAFRQLGFRDDIRGERISVDDFGRLAALLADDVQGWQPEKERRRVTEC